jgi:hypothetical protein
MIPMLLDFITVFCLVGGCLLLWLNLRPRRDQVIMAKSKPSARRPPKPRVDVLPVAREMQNNEPLKSEDKRMDKPFFDMLRQHLAEAQPTGPVDGDVAGGIAKSKTSNAPQDAPRGDRSAAVSSFDPD